MSLEARHRPVTSPRHAAATTATMVDANNDTAPALTSTSSSPTGGGTTTTDESRGKSNGTANEQAPKQSKQTKDNLNRTVMREEAEATLEALPGGATYLDGFSLLQVIANPRGNPEDLLTSTSPTAASSSSFHGRYGDTANTTGGGDYTVSDLFSGTYYSLESTVVSVTESMNQFNSVLEGWSRQILEEDPFAPSPADGEDEVPESQLRELPVELRQSLSGGTADLKKYLEQSGLLAHAFRERQPILTNSATASSSRHSNTASTTGAVSAATDTTNTRVPTKVLTTLREQVPAVFWDTENPVDLTDGDTFQQVFLEKDPVAIGTSTTETMEESLSAVSVFDFFPLVPEDSLSPWLDQIELALLEAVREKSSDFFVESVRFGKLQDEIHALLSQVQQAQVDAGFVQDHVVKPSLNLPLLDQERNDCQQLLLVLDNVQDMLQAKASIPGFLSAAEDLTALEQVQYGRQQLTSTALNEDKEENSSATIAVSAVGDRQRPLSHLTALQGVSKQLDQYQELIVTNLREELVEVFMDWKPTAAGKPSNHDRIQDIVKALHSCQGWGATWQAYRNRLHDVLRLTLRTIVGEFASSPTSNLTVQGFLECLDVTTEQFMALLQAAVAVKAYCLEHNVFVGAENQLPSKEPSEEAKEGETHSTDGEASSGAVSDPIEEEASGVVVSSAELAAKSVSELLRLRKEAHSLVTLDEMKQIWDKCSSFSVQLEELTGARATVMRSALLSQVKAFAERQHEKQMSALAAALDSERWLQCQVSSDRQDKISKLCTGRAILARGFNSTATSASEERKPDVLVGGVHYKVVWSCLLLVEMIMNDLMAAAHFTGLSTLMVTKIADLLRLFNARTTQLVLGAGAIHSAARLKSINAKHLSLVTQCLGLIIAVFPHVRAALMAHLPTKQHTLLTSLDTIKKEYAEHNEKVLNKFVTIIGGIVEHGLAPKLAGTDFDVRAEQIPLSEDGSVPSCVFFEGISTNVKKMHHVLFGLLPPDHLLDVFSRIFAFIDQKVPTIIVDATKPRKSTSATGSKSSPQRQMSGPRFTFPTTDAGKRRLLLEAEAMTKDLNGLDSVQAWDFSAVNVLEIRLEYSLKGGAAGAGSVPKEDEATPNGDEDDKNESSAGPSNGRKIDNGEIPKDSVPNDDDGDKESAPQPESEAAASPDDPSNGAEANGVAESTAEETRKENKDVENKGGTNVSANSPPVTPHPPDGAVEAVSSGASEG